MVRKQSRGEEFLTAEETEDLMSLHKHTDRWLLAAAHLVVFVLFTHCLSQRERVLTRLERRGKSGSVLWRSLDNA